MMLFAICIFAALLLFLAFFFVSVVRRTARVFLEDYTLGENGDD